ncbi:MAG: redoxin domain-containing protein [Terriglobia bacterium]
MRKLAIVLGVVVVVAGAAFYGWRAYSGPSAPPPEVAVGGAVADFTLADTNGQAHSLASLRGSQGTLLLFISTRCPVSNNYNERMETLHRNYGVRGIRVVGINPNRTEPVEEVRQHAQEKGLTFVVLKDVGNRIADYFGASVTPEAYLLDTKNVLRYHGRLDADQHEPSLKANELRVALEALLDGREITNIGKKAFGCSIKRV